MDKEHHGHRERVKQEFRKMGIGHFPDHKIMELLLYYSIPRSDTNETGHRLIKKFGSFSGVFDAPYDLLCETEGVGQQSATLIKLVAGIIKTYMDDSISHINSIKTTDDAINYMKYKFLSETLECVYMLCLGNNGKILLFDKVAHGNPDNVEIIPSELIKMALRSNAVRVILAHNHPHGICNPSNQDLRTTSILFDEFRRVGVELTDHIIVAPDGEYSMKRHNMFPK